MENPERNTFNNSDSKRPHVNKTLRTKALDEVRFLRSWIGNPMKVGAVSPSGPSLAARMASYLNVHPGAHVLELGPGTGVVTKAILARGIPTQNLMAVEYSPDFCNLLRDRYAGLNVVQGDAYAIRELFDKAVPSGFVPGQLDGIVSSLPLFSRPEGERRDLIEAVLGLLKPGAPFIQFSYALVPPVKAENGSFTLEKSEWIWKNLPPARVWVYRRGN